MVDSKKVKGRRTLSFHSLDDLEAEVRRLAAVPSAHLANWTLAENLDHLTRTMNASIDGLKYRAPFWLRFLGPWMKSWVLRGPMPVGFKLDPQLALEIEPTPGIALDAALSGFLAAMDRQRRESHREPNVALGPMTRDEWNRLHLRHAELHLSFVVPRDVAVPAT